MTPSTVPSTAATAQENADNYGDAASNLVLWKELQTDYPADSGYGRG